MKCAKCGAELKKGCLYCSVCGHEAQIVSDYNVLEDDYLRSLLKDGEGEKNPQEKEPEPKKTKKKKKSHLALIVCCCLIITGAAVGIAVKLYIDNKNANSYDYQIEMAEKERVDRNYENALRYYKTALALQPDDIKVREAMAEIYTSQKEYDSALVLYMEILQLDKTNKEAYQHLISIYDEMGDYDSILSLKEDVTDENILALFDDYEVGEPIISPLSGQYDDYITVVIYSIAGNDIYYTTDGTVPDKENGIPYPQGGIPLNHTGNFEINAVCCNEKGIYSDIVTEEYQIQFKKPDLPSVSPDGGVFSEETTVTITQQKDCTIYYTWDFTDPTTESAVYTEPIVVPEGDYVLSVMAVNNKTGLVSDIYRVNFGYHP